MATLKGISPCFEPSPKPQDSDSDDSIPSPNNFDEPDLDFEMPCQPQHVESMVSTQFTTWLLNNLKQSKSQIAHLEFELTQLKMEFENADIRNGLRIAALEDELAKLNQKKMQSEKASVKYAIALYSFESKKIENRPANLSFEKNDVLEILDASGKWWRARKQHRDDTKQA
ncbi:hypothetical protein HK096_007688 [Nowakowskiella sp. JEL0078]|nr:hypothetical protein HK096_007688 [Nowakowskiella sp. JEL0078]